MHKYKLTQICTHPWYGEHKKTYGLKPFADINALFRARTKLTTLSRIKKTVKHENENSDCFECHLSLSRSVSQIVKLNLKEPILEEVGLLPIPLSGPALITSSPAGRVQKQTEVHKESLARDPESSAKVCGAEDRRRAKEFHAKMLQDVCEFHSRRKTLKNRHDFFSVF